MISMAASEETAREKRRASIGTALFAVAPATAAGLVPWLLTRWQVKRPVPGGLPAQCVGAVLIGAGAAVITSSFVRFAVEGLGTPSPFAQTKHLVVGGWYGYVRNPIYVALAASITGQGLLLGQPKLIGLAALGAVPAAAFVVFHEEPTLARTFGPEYEVYRDNVPRWVPRLTPWRRGPAPAM